MHCFGIACDDGQVGVRGLVGLYAILLPIAQGADRNVIARREIFLAQPEKSRLNQLQPLQTRMPVLADDDVIVHRDAERFCDVDDLLRHLDVGA